MRHPILRRIPGLRQWIDKMERLAAERDRLARRLRKMEMTKTEAPLAHPPPPPELRRDQYKDVWTKLSETEQQAKFHVGGFEEEEIFEREGIITRDYLLATVGVVASDVVVEIGCGVGRVGKQLAPLCRRWIGCDVSPHMAALAGKRLSNFGNVELHEITGFDLRPLADEMADVVYCTVVFMHLEEWDRYNYVLEAYRVLRPGGRVFIDNVNLCSDLGWKVFEVHRQLLPIHRPPHITKHSTAAELTTYLERAGFKDVRSREIGEWVQAWGTR